MEIKGSDKNDWIEFNDCYPPWWDNRNKPETMAKSMTLTVHGLVDPPNVPFKWVLIWSKAYRQSFYKEIIYTYIRRGFPGGAGGKKTHLPMQEM